MKTKKDDWLRLGLGLLADSGRDALTIENLTQGLGVTKGSFYHHFKNRVAYSKALLTFWEETMTMAVIRQSNRGTSALEKMNHLTEQVDHKGNTPLEVAIRAWALRDPMAQEIQARVDHRRLSYCIQLATELTGSEKDGAHLGNLIFYSFVGAQQTHPPLQRKAFRDTQQYLLSLAINSRESK